MRKPAKQKKYPLEVLRSLHRNGHIPRLNVSNVIVELALARVYDVRLSRLQSEDFQPNTEQIIATIEARAKRQAGAAP